MFCFKKRKDLTDKVVLVTGGANGLGRELAIQFAKLRCKIAIADLDIENAEKTVKEIVTQGICSDARAYKVDVSKLDDIENLKLQVEKDLGVLDIVVNNAAILYTKPIETEDPKELEKIIDVNVMSVIWTTRVFLGEMKRRKSGHIISISSIAGLAGGPNLHSYSTSKYAVRGFMDSLHLELNREGFGNYIKTTTVYPWYMNTRDDIQNYIKRTFKYCPVLDTKDVAKKVINGVRCNKRVVAVPWFFYFFGYVINITDFSTAYSKFFTRNQNEDFKTKS